MRKVLRKHLLTGLLTAVSAMFGDFSLEDAEAQTTNSWTSGVSGKWENGANWSSGAPTNSNAANLITNATTKTVTIDATTTNAANITTLTISNLTMQGFGAGINTLQLTSAGTNTPLRIFNGFTLGTNAVLVVTNSALRVDGLSGGSFIVDGSVTNLAGGQIIVTNAAITIGNTYTVFGSGNFTTSGGSLLASNVVVGQQGTLTLAGGSNALSSLGVGVGFEIDASTVWVTGGQLVVTNGGTTIGLAGDGQMTVSNGTWRARDVTVGGPGYSDAFGTSGTLTIAGGTSVLSGQLLIGDVFVFEETPLRSYGAVWVTGGQLVVTNDTVFIGDTGFGQMTVSSGIWLGSDVTVGTSAGSQGTLTIAGGINTLSTVSIAGGGATGTVWVTDGQLTVNGKTSVGNFGVGQMTVSNGTWLAADVHVSINSDATLTVAGGTSTLSYLSVGEEGLGTVWVTGGQLTTTTGVIIGNDPGTGQMTVSNGTWLAGGVNVGLFTGQGTLTIAGGTNTLTELVIGAEFPAAGTVWLTGGQLTVTNFSTSIGLAGGVGQMIVSNGTWRARDVTVGLDGGSPGTLTVAGGTSFVSSNLIIGDFACAATGTVVVAGGDLDVENASFTAVLEVRSGSLILNSGELLVDHFVMTNACATFVRTGGTFGYGTAVLDPNRDDDGDGISNGYEQSHGLDPLNATDANVDSDGDGFTNLQEFQTGTDATNSLSSLRITAITKESNDLRVTWMTGPGKTNALERTAGTANGSYSNNFAAIFTVTNTVGTVTNYLDLGGATNFPARYYRVRLVP